MRYLFFILFACTYYVNVLAQKQSGSFSHYKFFHNKEGLYTDKINDIEQDSYGNIWLATGDGLFMYDGHIFESFEDEKNQTDLIQSNILCILKDQQQNLWFGSNKGLFFYDQNKNQFKTINLNNTAAFVSSLTEDNNGTIWASTHNGIYSIHQQAQQITYHPNFSRLSETLVITDPSQKNLLYIITPNDVYTINKRTFAIVDQFHYQTQLFKDQSVHIKAQFNHARQLWISNLDGGIFLIDLFKKTKRYFPLSNLNNKINDLIIQQDELWICVDDLGVLKYDASTQTFHSFETTENNHLPAYKISCLFLDKENNIWLGIDKNGLALTNHYFNYFTFNNTFLKDNNKIIAALTEDHLGNLWIGTDGGGIYVLDAQQNIKHHFKKNKTQINSLANDAVQCIYKDTKNRIWVGTYEGGLSLYVPFSNQFKNYNQYSGSRKSLLKNDVRKITEDQQGNLWLAVHGKGVSMFDPNTETFTHYDQMNTLWTNDIFISKKGNVWVASSTGISRKLANEKQFRNISESINSLNESFVNCLYEDNNETMWFGTLHGLYYYDQNNHRFEACHLSPKLAKASIKSITQDQQGQLLVSSHLGFFKINISQKTYQYFSKDDGLKNENFIINAAYLTKEKYYLGTSDGYCWFHPNENILSHHLTPIFIKAIKINNQPISSINGYESIANLKKMHTLDLPYALNNIVLNFSYPTYNKGSNKSILEYKINGYDKDWQAFHESMELSFFHLKPGRYELMIRTHQDQSKTAFTFNINIHPPFYETWWFRISLVLLIALLIYFYYKYKTRRLKIQNQKLQEGIQLSTYEISQQNMLLAKQSQSLNLANKTKDKLFSIIAHDLKGPFTSILSMSNVLYTQFDQTPSNNAKEIVSEISKSSHKALNLLDNLLKWAQSQELTFTPIWVNIPSTINKVIENLSFIKNEKNIEVSYHHNQAIEALIDKNIFETILRNIFHNAIKFSHPNSMVQISIENKPDNNGFVLCIQDFGVGMSKEVINKIIHHEMLSAQKGTQGEVGSGVGLSILYDFFKLNAIDFDIQSELDKGTTITLTYHTDTRVVEQQATTSQSTDETTIAEININTPQLFQFKDKTILIVDDQEEIRNALTIQLKNYFNLHTASNGEEALALAQSILPDLIITDVVMPQMNGIELSQQLKNTPLTAHIPIIFLTAQDSEQDIIKGLISGVDDYQTKPFNPQILLLKIRNLLIARELLKNKYQTETQTILEDVAYTSLDKKLLAEVNELIQKNISNEEFTVEQLSIEVGMHRSNLTKKMTALTGLTPNEVIKTQRMKLAQTLFLNTDKNISEVAYECGYSDPKYFSKVFKNHFGILPSDFVNNKRNLQ